MQNIVPTILVGTDPTVLHNGGKCSSILPKIKGGGMIFNMLDRMLIIMKLLTLHYLHKIELIHLCVYCGLMVLLRFSYELYYNGVLLALA